MERKKLNPAITAVIVVVLIGIVTTAVIVLNKKKSTDITDSTAQTTTATPDTSTTAAANTADSSTTPSGASEYKDGTYTETGNYVSPGGAQSIKLTVTITGDIITNTSLVQQASDSESAEHQGDFASGYKSLVVGKKVDSVSLSRVSGSSLTSTGFNAALAKIKADAKA